MEKETRITFHKQSSLAIAGQEANTIASSRVFEDYRQRRSYNTIRKQSADLDLFVQYLQSIHIRIDGDMAASPQSWHGVTWGIISGFVQWQLKQGYAVGSVNGRLSTVKTYARLAFQAGVIDATEHALIRTVSGYAHKEARSVDEQRAAGGVETRIGRKKAAAVSIGTLQAKQLKRGQPDTPQGRRDALLMSLLLDHGLRCGEVAILTVGNFNMTDGTLTFYRPKIDKAQIHNLSKDTRGALKAYAPHMPLAADAPILRGSRRAGKVGDSDGKLTNTAMNTAAITSRVKVLGERIGIKGLSAHDCRHYWATTAARNGTDTFTLQEAGGWTSLSMLRRYVELAKISNDGVNLGDTD